MIQAYGLFFARGLHIQCASANASRTPWMSVISVDVGAEEPHSYAVGTTVGEVVLNVHGRKHGAAAALADGVARDFSHVLESDRSVESIDGSSEVGLYLLRHPRPPLLAPPAPHLPPAARPSTAPPPPP